MHTALFVNGTVQDTDTVSAIVRHYSEYELVIHVVTEN